jgi:hypothetical protein
LLRLLYASPIKPSLTVYWPEYISYRPTHVYLCMWNIYFSFLTNFDTKYEYVLNKCQVNRNSGSRTESKRYWRWGISQLSWPIIDFSLERPKL